MSSESPTPPRTLPHNFNPLEHLVSIKVRGGGNQLYLNAEVQKIWLRLEHADAQIVTEAVELTDKIAIFKAAVTIPEGPIGMGHGSETQGDFGDFIEKAETKSVSRALDNLGYSLEMAKLKFTMPANIAQNRPPPQQPTRPPQQATRPASAQVAAQGAVAAQKTVAAQPALPATADPADAAPTPTRAREADDRKEHAGDWGAFNVTNFQYAKEAKPISPQLAHVLRETMHAKGYSALSCLARIHQVEREAADEGAMAGTPDSPYRLEELRPGLAKQVQAFLGI